MQRRTVQGGADAGQFAQSILPHMNAAYNLARFLSRHPSVSEDIVQEAYLRAWRAFAGFRGGDPRAWLLAIVRNCFFTHVQAGRTASPADVAELHAHDTPESEVMREQDIERVRLLVGELPEPFRETLVLRELEDLSYRQIAAITGVPLGTVMSRLARARALLGARLQAMPGRKGAA